MEIINDKIILDEDDRQFLIYMVSLNMIKEFNDAVTMRNIAQIWYDRGYLDALAE